MTAAQALGAVGSGARVWIQSGTGTPSTLVNALVAHGSKLRDVEIVHMMTLGSADYTRPEYEGHFRHRGLFLGENTRDAVAAGRADYTPIFLAEIENLFVSGAMPLDVVLMQVSPPDEHGFVSLGTTVGSTLTASRNAGIIIAEVNDQMPRTHGDTFLHVSHMTAVVETSRPLLELPAVAFSDVHLQVARNVASLIPDGATLQTGIGGIPEAVLTCLGDKRDLGIHSEMLGDSVIELIEGGIAGSVNLRTRVPFDARGELIQIGAKVNYGDAAREFTPDVNAFYSNRWQTGIGELGLQLGGGLGRGLPAVGGERPQHRRPRVALRRAECLEHRRRRTCPRAVDDATLAIEIEAIWETSGRTYGSPRVHRWLRRQGFRVARKRVARIMRTNGWVGESARKGFKTTTPDKAAVPAPDLGPGTSTRPRRT